MTDDCCGSQPPRTLVDDEGQTWLAGNCWCTLDEGHEGQCLCEPCFIRNGAPGWVNEHQYDGGVH